MRAPARATRATDPSASTHGVSTVSRAQLLPQVVATPSRFPCTSQSHLLCGSMATTRGVQLPWVPRSHLLFDLCIRAAVGESWTQTTTSLRTHSSLGSPGLSRAPHPGRSTVSFYPQGPKASVCTPGPWPTSAWFDRTYPSTPLRGLCNAGKRTLKAHSVTKTHTSASQHLSMQTNPKIITSAPSPSSQPDTYTSLTGLTTFWPRLLPNADSDHPQ